MEEYLDRFQKMKRARIELTRKELEKKAEVKEKWFIADMARRFGFRKATLYDYMETLETLRLIEREDGVIRYVRDNPEQDD